MEDAKNKTSQALAALQQAQAEASQARQRATNAAGTPQAAALQQIAQAAEAKVIALGQAHLQASKNENLLQQSVNNDAVNTYVAQQRYLSLKSGQQFNETNARTVALGRINEIKNNLDNILRIDPRFNNNS